MKLHRADSLSGFLSHQRISKPLCQPSFSRSWWALQNDVFLASQLGKYFLNRSRFKETPVIYNIINCINALPFTFRSRFCGVILIIINGDVFIINKIPGSQ